MYGISVWHWYFWLAGLFPCEVQSCSPLPISHGALWRGDHSRRHLRLKSELLHSCCKSFALWPDSCPDRGMPRGGRRTMPASLPWSWSRPHRPSSAALDGSGWRTLVFHRSCKGLGCWIFLSSFLPFLQRDKGKLPETACGTFKEEFCTVYMHWCWCLWNGGSFSVILFLLLSSRCTRSGARTGVNTVPTSCGASLLRE